MLQGDIIWMYVKESGKKLKYEEGYMLSKKALQDFNARIANTICTLAIVYS
jgi:hypothetical protein